MYHKGISYAFFKMIAEWKWGNLSYCKAMSVIFNAQLSERFKLDRKMSSFDQSISAFETGLCTNDKHVIAKCIKCWNLNGGRTGKQFRIKWSSDFGCSIQID